ncbi:MAG: lipase family protein [Pseudobacteriovorax sp.]|nr:lipase family protein [Pseudobacteriovorax sp.]
MKAVFFISFFLVFISCKHSQSDQEQSSVHALQQDKLIPSFTSETFEYFPECSVQPKSVQFTLSREFHPENAYLLLLASLLSEEKRPKRTIPPQLEAWGFANSRVYNHAWWGLRLFIAEHQDFLLVTFRGTKTLSQNISNAMFSLVDAKDFEGRVHRGFYGVYRRQKKKVLRMITEANSARKPIVFAGHSRGGAMASLFALAAVKNGLPVHQVYSFGQPRFGDLAFNRFVDSTLDNRFFRVENFNDITPNLPPPKEQATEIANMVLENKPLIKEQNLAGIIENLSYSFTAGKAYYLSADGLSDKSNLGPTPETHQSLEFWQQFKETVEAEHIIAVIKSFRSHLNDHLPPQYICHLENNLEN